MTAVGCTGHQEMPEVAARHAQDQMQRLLGPLAGPELIGYSSLAAGADQMFADVVLSLGGQLRLIIPSDNYGSTFGGGTSLADYQRLLAQASDAETLDYPQPSEEAFFAAGKLIATRSDWLIAVWDGGPARGLGGSADVVAYARSHDKDVIVLWPKGVTR